MKTVKKLLALFFAFVSVLSFTACDKLDDSSLLSESSAESVAEPSSESDALDYFPITTAMHGGTAKTLTGNCLVYNVFVNDAESEWSDSSVDSVLEMLDEALTFIKHRFDGSDFGGELSLRYTDADSSAFISFDGAAPTDADGMTWLSYAFSQTEHGSPNAFLKDCAKNVSGYDNICFLFLYNKPGRSFATPYDSQYGDCEDFRYERAQIFFSTDRSFDYFCNPAVIAHELLHLFGAIDLYEPYVSAEDASRVAELFPTELMRFEPTDIFLSEISALTAYLIGWTETLDEEYNFLFD